MRQMESEQKRKNRIECLKQEILALKFIRDSSYGQPTEKLSEEVKEKVTNFYSELSDKIDKKTKLYGKLVNKTLNKPEYIEQIGEISKIYDHGSLARISIYVKTPDGEDRSYNCYSNILKRKSMPVVGQKVLLKSRKTKRHQSFDKYNAKIYKFL